VNLFGDHIRRVDHTADVDRAILRQVYVWAEAKSAIYLDGSGYRDAEDFLDPPRGSVEYIVFAGDNPAALLTLISLVMVRGVYQVGLITNPQASLRKICKLLRGFMGWSSNDWRRRSSLICPTRRNSRGLESWRGFST
jgi:hypothetical protein